MYKAILLPLAKQDIKEAAKWYNKKQKGLGKRFTLQVRQKIGLLKREPYLSAIRYDEIRTAVWTYSLIWFITMSISRTN
jgi:hypothetical protein